VRLRERHRASQDDFTIRSQQDLLATATQITGFITLFLGSVLAAFLTLGVVRGAARRVSAPP